MQNRWVARVFLGLIFVFPLLASAQSAVWTGPVRNRLGNLAPVLAVEAFLVAGSIFAFRERRRLVAELEVARTRIPSSSVRSTSALPRSIVPIKTPIYGNLKH